MPISAKRAEWSRRHCTWGSNCTYGNMIKGPAVIVEPTTTIAIQPTYITEVTKYGNYLIKHSDGRGNGKRS